MPCHSSTVLCLDPPTSCTCNLMHVAKLLFPNDKISTDFLKENNISNLIQK